MKACRSAIEHVACCALLVGCANDGPAVAELENTDAGGQIDAGAETDDAAPRPAVTWFGDLGPLVEAQCMACHDTSGAAPIDLGRWAQVESNAALIVDAVSNQRMPPWSLDDSCAPIEGARGLSADERALFAAWRDGGYARGDEATLEAPSTRDAFAVLGAPDEVLRPTAPYVFDPREIDVQVVTEFELENADGRWLRAVRIVPSALSITHHGQIDGLVGNTQTGEFDVFSYFVAGWAPGFDGVVYPDDAPMYVPPSATLRLDMHYSSVSVGVDSPPIADSTEIQLWWSDVDDPEFESVSYSPMRQGFVVPAGAESHEVVARGRFEVDGEIVSVAPHMHLFGTQISLSVNDGDNDQCVVRVLDFDFWQHGIYVLRPDGRVPVSAGMPWTLRCVYDNSPANQPMVGGVVGEPRDVRQGGTTLDEMCVVATVIRVRRDAATP